MKATDTKSFIELSKNRFLNRFNYDLTKFIRSNQKVNIECKLHGIFSQTPNSHLDKRGNGRMSSMSKRKCFNKQ